MINLLVDEAYAYDYLSILEAKFYFAKEKDKLKALHNSIHVCIKTLEEQVGEFLNKKVIESEEYYNLSRANKEIFLAVERIKQGNVRAKEIDDLNYERYICKQEIQKKFFTNALTETKIGY